MHAFRVSYCARNLFLVMGPLHLIASPQLYVHELLLPDQVPGNFFACSRTSTCEYVVVAAPRTALASPVRRAHVQVQSIRTRSLKKNNHRCRDQRRPRICYLRLSGFRSAQPHVLRQNLQRRPCGAAACCQKLQLTWRIKSKVHY